MAKLPRRKFLKLTGAVGMASCLGGVPNSARAQAKEMVLGGGGGGSPFRPLYPKSLMVSHSRDSDNCVRVHNFTLNGVSFAQPGGEATEFLSLRDGEYFNRVQIRHGAGDLWLVDRVRFWTNQGRSVGTGGFCADDAKAPVEWANGRVAMIGGRHGARLDRLEIEVIEGYEPSENMKRNEFVVLDHFNPNSTYKETDETEDRFLRTHSKAMTRQTEKSISVSAGVEFAKEAIKSKSSISGSYSVSNTTFRSVSSEVSRLSRQIETRKEIMDPSTHGFEVAKCDIFRDQTGAYFIMPTEPSLMVKLREDQFDTLNGVLNLVPGITLATQNRFDLRPDFTIGNLERLVSVSADQ